MLCNKTGGGGRVRRRRSGAFLPGRLQQLQSAGVARPPGRLCLYADTRAQRHLQLLPVRLFLSRSKSLLLPHSGSAYIIGPEHTC